MEKSGFENFQSEIESLLMGKKIQNLFKIILLEIDQQTTTTNTKKRKNDEEITSEGGKREMPKNSNFDN